MKKVLIITAMILTAATNVYADHHQSIGGLVLGAGGGALVGQALGRNTESTVIGTAVGSVLGYIIGSEMDNSHRYSRRVYRHSQPLVHQQRNVIQHNYYYEPADHPPRIEVRCKEAEVLGTINGRARKMYTTVCKTPRGWEIAPEEPASYDNIGYGTYRNFAPHGTKHGYRKKHYKQRWAKHRF